MKIPTVKSLKFEEIAQGCFQARHTFRNGYTALVRYGKGTATTIGVPYELQVIPIVKGHTYLSDDVVGYSTEQEINLMMNEVAHLKKLRSHEEMTDTPKFDW